MWVVTNSATRDWLNLDHATCVWISSAVPEEHGV